MYVVGNILGKKHQTMAYPAAVNCSGAARRILLLPTTTTRPATRSFPGRLSAVTSRPITTLPSTPRTKSKSTPKTQPPTTPPPQPLQTRRTYHSTTHPPPPSPFTQAETTLLTTALTSHIPTHGFTLPSLTLAARDLSLLDISPSFLGPSPVARLIHFHLYTTRTTLPSLASQHSDLLSGLSVSEKFELLTWLRLKQNEPIIQHWQQALAVMAQPFQVPVAVRELAMLADEIYYLAGDKSVDPSWYTKRAALSGIYAAAELFMTTDKSEGFQETRRFLRRRLQEAEELGGAVRSVGEWVGFTASAGVNLLRSKGVRI
ncbi:Ubiquinone biosynthesis protein coq9, mitochondrial [Podospora pseudoanserina]|uniref:Ubiquinone biosynthesis protein n=1 Tax=Podospora pseudoanserina TaxID=2609844 RepID=A0ABR0I5I2_9PEZI|nr:Ubiquinone biosynthesis protein coq9, mitochondrial [Podospora pseudoanserina]